ncbi:hypothetical protein KY284_022263 [Solanum tuberosum]|nr:hypothetical protein KY284_022263 [Solanum tuberosum]
MLDIGIDGSWLTLRIHVNERPLIEPTNSFNDDNDSIGNERLGDHSKESLGDHSNESLGDHSMNIHDDSTDVENKPVDAEDPEREYCEEMQGEQELRSQSNHYFSDGTNLCINQTFIYKNELQLLLAEAATKKSFVFCTLRSCTKYLKVKCVSHNCAWMLRARKYECSDRFCIYKYIGEHNCGFEHANSSHRKISIKVIASHCGGVVAKEMVRGIVENGYSCLPAFSYMFETLNNKCPAAAVILEYDIGFEKWSSAHFPVNRYDVMTTNIAESRNAMLIDEREYPMASIFNSIVKRKEMIEGDSLYVENVTGDDNQFTVFGAGVTAHVDLREKSCSCIEYDLIKIHCAHAMAALRSKHGNEYGMSIYEYSSPLFKVESYLLAYLDSINIVALESEWCVPEELLNVKILSPLVDTKLGRKQTKRVKGVM